MLKYVFAIITMPFYLPIMIVVGLICGVLETIDLTIHTFYSIVNDE